MPQMGLAGWSLCRRFHAKQLALLDYPRVAKEEFGLDIIELNSPFFESTEEDYLDQLNAKAAGAGVQMVHISVDGQGNLSALNEEERKEAVAKHARWIEIAASLGCGSIRGNAGGSDAAPDAEVEACTRSFKELAGLGEMAGVKFVMENHGGLSRNPGPMVKVFRAVNSPWVGACPDFNNFAPDIRYAALEDVAPWAVVVHAKMLEFDDNGEEKNIDVGRCIRIFERAGYDGVYLIEYEGAADDHEGVLKSKALLQKHLMI
jgi:L-ribulose-5-phosphate 3-epimerase